MNWINKDTDIYCSFAKNAGNTGCQIMNTMFYYYGLNKIYKSFSINNIKEGIDAVKILDIKGFAVTMPFKIDVLDYLDEISEEAQSIGAVNTVLNNKGYLKGYNTDYLAALQLLKTKDKNVKVYVLGNGGYARAVIKALETLEFKYDIITRNNWHKISYVENSIIYNCTPVEDLIIHPSNDFINCIVSSITGKELAKFQASYQFELYTGLKFF